MVKPGATMVDVGINRITTREEFDRYFAGDEPPRRVLPDERLDYRRRRRSPAFARAGAYTPVPGGVGPLTIAMLMANTVRAAKLRRGCGR